MKGYKGFNPDFTCKGKQYQENTVYEESEATICEKGMHFCKNPLDVLEYYPLLNSDCELNTFAEVEAQDNELTDDGKKFCTKKLKIGAKLDLKGFINASFNFLWEKTKNNDAKHSSGDSAQMASSGCYAQMASSGYYAQMASSGYSAKMASSGDSAKMASSGDYAQMASSGDSAKMASSGDSAQMASSGDSAQMASSGCYAQMASSGDYAQMASSGDYAQMASSGDHAQMASSGDYAKMDIKGYYGVGANIGIDGKIKGAKGTWVTLAEYKYNHELNENICVCVKSAQIDGEILKENTWYKLRNGEFVEFDNDD